jgi:hypothetical protein
MTETLAPLPDPDTVPVPGSLVIVARAAWPEPGDGAPPPLTGFVVSSFSPLVAAVADRCLSRSGKPPAPVRAAVEPAAGSGGAAPALVTALVLGSVGGDVATNVAAARAVDAGKAVSPLLFFQSVPNAVLGLIAKRWSLTGPVLCVSPPHDPVGAALAAAELLIADGDADEALVLAAEQAPDDAGRDAAVALLVRRA